MSEARVQELEDTVARLLMTIESLTDQVANLTELATVRGEYVEKLEDRIRRMERLAIRDEIDRSRKAS